MIKLRSGKEIKSVMDAKYLQNKNLNHYSRKKLKNKKVLRKK